MKILTVLRRTSFVASLLLSSQVLTGSVRSEINGHDAADMGLVVAWQTNVGGSPLAHGRYSFAIWPHSTARREFVTVRTVPRDVQSSLLRDHDVAVAGTGIARTTASDILTKAGHKTLLLDQENQIGGGRVLQSISGNEVDFVTLGKAIEQGERPAESPRLGLAGAIEKAERLVATYKKLGRKIELEPFSQQLTYLVTLTSDGIVEAIDAESGAILWKAEAGDSRLPMFGPGVSDENVVITNGNMLYVFELATGDLLNTRKLVSTPTGSPTAIPGKAIVPSIDGRLVSYDIKNPNIPPFVLRTGTENRLGVVSSADRNFLSWPMNTRLFVAKALAKVDKSPILWNSIEMGEPIADLPITVQDGFVFCGRNGTVIHCSTERNDSILWRARLAVPVSKSPIANRNFVFVVSDSEMLFALDLTNGAEVWDSPAINVKDLVAIGIEHIYVTNSAKKLVALDISTGRESSRSSILAPTVLPNTVSDRLFFVNSSGQLTSLREINAPFPTFAAEFKSTDVAQSKPKVQSTTDGQSKSAEDTSNVFEGAGAAENASNSADPFGTDPF